MTMNEITTPNEKRDVFCIDRKCEYLEHDRTDIEYGWIENIPIKCNRCGNPSAYVVPIPKEYPTYRPGTRLTDLQKAVRALLREWMNGWPSDKGRLCKQAGITDATTIRRMCASKEMPYHVYEKLYHTRIVGQ